MVAKVVQDAHALVQQSKDILHTSTVNTFLGRKTQEPFPEASVGLETRNLGSHASQISTVAAAVSHSGGSNKPRSDAAGTEKDGIGV